MTNLKQIQQDIQTLPEDALDLLAQYIQLLKKSYPAPPSTPTSDPSLAPDTTDWSDFIGCMEAEADLSVNYKTYLAEALAQKYDHH